MTINSLPVGNGDQMNPYSDIPINKSDLCLIQQRLKWENGVWSDLDQLTIRKKILHCCVRKEAHWEMARSMDSKVKIMNLPKLLLSSVLGTSLVAGASGDNREGISDAMDKVNAVISVILAIMTALTTFYSFEEKKAAHRHSSLSYGKLVGQMERLLQMAPEDRKNFGSTLAELNETYASIRDDAPFLDVGLLASYINQFNSHEDASSGIADRSGSGVRIDVSSPSDEKIISREEYDMIMAELQSKTSRNIQMAGRIDIMERELIRLRNIESPDSSERNAIETLERQLADVATENKQIRETLVRIQTNSGESKFKPDLEIL
jgi:hypothetical protein